MKGLCATNGGVQRAVDGPAASHAAGHAPGTRTPFSFFPTSRVHLQFDRPFPSPPAALLAPPTTRTSPPPLPTNLWLPDAVRAAVTATAADAPLVVFPSEGTVRAHALPAASPRLWPSIAEAVASSTGAVMLVHRLDGVAAVQGRVEAAADDSLPSVASAWAVRPPALAADCGGAGGEVEEETALVSSALSARRASDDGDDTLFPTPPGADVAYYGVVVQEKPTPTGGGGGVDGCYILKTVRAPAQRGEGGCACTYYILSRVHRGTAWADQLRDAWLA